jgi:hypothetical protein
VNGHSFVRPGQVAPDLPPPDACVRCGQPFAAHGAELAARVTAAQAVLADYQAAMREFTLGAVADVDALSWSLRLGQHLQQLVDGVDAAAVSQPQATTSHVRPDGSAWITHADLLTVLGGLADAREFTDPASAARYAALARQLGNEQLGEGKQ